MGKASSFRSRGGSGTETWWHESNTGKGAALLQEIKHTGVWQRDLARSVLLATKNGNFKQETGQRALGKEK
jgi:hypothetical protein